MCQDTCNLDGSSFQWIDQLYREHGSFIESVIRFAVRDAQERDDIYQEVFMALLTIAKPAEIQNLRNYLYILTINKVNEHKQKKFRGKQILKDYADQQMCVQPSFDGDSLAIQEETDKILDLIGRALSKKESQAVLLRYRDKSAADEAARVMNISKESFIRYVSVGIKKIRTIVQSGEKTDK